MANLVRVREELDRRGHSDCRILSVSLDPEHDTPEVLSRYAEQAGAPATWRFLTGKLADIEQLRRALGIFDPDPLIDADRSQHAGLVVLGSDPLNRWAAVSSLQEPRLIADTLDRLLEP